MSILRKAGIAAGSAAISVAAICTLASPANAAATGSNGSVYATISNSPYNLSAHSTSRFYGHLQVLDFFGSVYNTPDEWSPSFNNLEVWTPSGRQVCVIGWEKLGDGSYQKVGEPCFWIE